MEPTRYFEAHGTGSVSPQTLKMLHVLTSHRTPTGDPIEASAIGAAFRGSRSKDDPLYVGSVKGNIGHTEGASGLASVIKACLIMEKGIIPRGGNFEKLNPRIDDIGLNLKFPVESVPWPSTGLRRISVNSFGASGTNAHVVLDDAYHFLMERGIQGNHCTNPVPSIKGAITLDDSSHGYPNRPSKNTPRLMLLSGPDTASLNRQIEQYTSWLKSSPESLNSPSFLEDLAYTLTQRRTHHTTRSFAVVDSLESLADFKPKMSSPIRSAKEPHIGFCFTGQGAQWAGMARELLRFPFFRENVQDSNAQLQQLGFSWDIWDVLRETKNAVINSPMLSQTLCTVIQVAIADLFLALDLVPTAVIGHSSGEIGAAYAAGAISKHSALKLAYYRGVCSGYLAKETNKSHGMMAVGLSPDMVQPLIDIVATSHPTKPALVVACINSPESVTVSGEVQQLDELGAILAEQQHFHRKLKVDVAYHSPQMKQVATAYRENVASILEPDDARRVAVMVSSVTGDIVQPQRLREVEYWVQNMLQTVRFSDAVTRLCVTSATSNRRKKLDGSHRNNVTVQLLVEIGPHAALQGPIRDTLKNSTSTATMPYYSTLLRGSPADRTVLSTLGSLFCHGCNIDFDLANNLDESRVKQPKVLPDLPEYAFDHSRTYWPTTRLTKEFRFRRHEKRDLVGKPVMDWNPLEARWRNFFKISEVPWVADHKVSGAIIYPAAGMIVMAVEAAKQLADPARELKGYNITDAYFLTALTIPETPEGIETNLVLRPEQSDSGRKTDAWAFYLYSYDNGTWVKNCNGKIQLDYYEVEDEVDKGAQQRNLLQNRTNWYKLAIENAKYVRSASQFYAGAGTSGYDFGPSFQRLDNLHYSDFDGQQCAGTVSCFPWKTVDNHNHVQPHVVHPCTLDGMLVLTFSAYSRAGTDIVSTAIPVEIESLWISDKGLNYPDTSFIRSVAKLGTVTNMGYEVSASAFDPEINTVLLDLKGGRFRFVAKDSALGESEDPQICYSIQWKPDIALLEQENNSEVSIKPRNVRFADRDGVQGPLLAFLELVTFKTPSLKILHLSHEPPETQQQLVESFFHPKGAEHHRVLPHGDYTLITMPIASKEDLKSIIEKYDGIKAVTWDGSKTLIPEVAEPEKYDLVFVSATVTNLIPQAAHILKSGGSLVVVDATAPSSQPNGHNEAAVDQLRVSLGDNGLSVLESFSDTDKLVVSSKPLKTQAKSAMRFALITDQGSIYQQELAYALQKAILKTAQDCQIESLQHLRPAADDELTYIFLTELEYPTLEQLSPELFFILQQTLIAAKGVLWLTAQEASGQISPNRAMVDGLARVVRSENPKCAFTTASLESGPLNSLVASITTLVTILDFSSTDHAYESEYKQANGQFLISRLIEAKEATEEVIEKSLPVISKKMVLKDCPPLRMWVGTPGLLDTLQFVEDTDYYDGVGPDEVEIKVDLIGLNFKDLLLALGRIEGTTFGHECAGTVSRVGPNVTDLKPGERVCAFSPTAFSTYSRVPRGYVSRVPDALSLEHAVCIPTQMTVGYFGLIEIAKLKKGETVLIHSAAGGTGQWAVQIAQRAGGEVFATVGSEEKKTFLMEQYGIPEDHIFSSRNTLFAKGIMHMTNNRGIDVVFNSLAGEALFASWNIIAAYGRFIEIGRKDISENNNLPMRPFTRGATFMALETSTMAKDDPSLASRTIESIFQDQVKGLYRPVGPIQVMPIQDVEKAFRMLQDGQMIGKIILKMTDDSVIPVSSPSSR
jgi:acyl transferase domain-containing protein/NADPH:quinone reductase-like Zn-dependent oxidoreductase